jgi:hypothetical protein
LLLLLLLLLLQPPALLANLWKQLVALLLLLLLPSVLLASTYADTVCILSSPTGQAHRGSLPLLLLLPLLLPPLLLLLQAQAMFADHFVQQKLSSLFVYYHSHIHAHLIKPKWARTAGDV